jgi:hypothetical protein
LFPTDFTAANGNARNVFDFTCDKHKKWKKPSSQVEYDLPDQLESITIISAGSLDAETLIETSYVQSKIDDSKKMELEFLGGMFSSSGSHRKNMDRINSHYKLWSKVSAYVSEEHADLIPYWNITAGTYLTDFIEKNLSMSYDQNPVKYQEFLSTFGTHFFMNARLGGVLSIEIETDGSYVAKTTSNNLELQAKATFFEKLSISGGITKENTNVDKSYKQKSTTKASYYGGKADLINAGSMNFQDWTNSVVLNPWLFGGKLTSILNFIPEGPKKIAMNTAIIVKLNYAYLDELLQSLNLLKQNLYIDVEIADNFLNQVNALRRQSIPQNQSVLRLGSEVEKFVLEQKKRAIICDPELLNGNELIICRELKRLCEIRPQNPEFLKNCKALSVKL